MNRLQQMFETVFAAAAFAERGMSSEACELRDERKCDSRPEATRVNQSRPRVNA